MRGICLTPDVYVQNNFLLEIKALQSAYRAADGTLQFFAEGMGDSQ
jgi:hypothetical protein